VVIPQIDIYSSANPTTKLQGLLWLFNATVANLISDDLTFNINAADYANLTGGSFGGIPFTLQNSQASGATNSGVSLTGINYFASCDASNNVYGLAQVVNAYAPASAEVLTIKLHSLGVN
jgi:hypothetical protein